MAATLRPLLDKAEHSPIPEPMPLWFRLAYHMLSCLIRGASSMSCQTRSHAGTSNHREDQGSR
jgi:hypothetical protein